MRAWDATGRGRPTITSWALRRSNALPARRHAPSPCAAAILLCLLAAVSLAACGREAAIDCAIDSGPCTTVLAAEGLSVTFDITPKPVSAMKTLAFRIDIKHGASPVTDGEVTVDLSMPGMAMPPNRVKLVHQGGGCYAGRGVIVRCPSGKAAWRAEARIRRLAWGDGQPRQALFTFGVK
ncbi:MAG: FixH family protein [Syntrophales bacterium]